MNDSAMARLFFCEGPTIAYAPVHAALQLREYRCEACGGVYTHGWSDEDARAEAEALWGGMPEDAAVVCDDCFKIICPAGDT
jgi:rubredoxin